MTEEQYKQASKIRQDLEAALALQKAVDSAHAINVLHNPADRDYYKSFDMSSAVTLHEAKTLLSTALQVRITELRKKMEAL